MRCLLLLLTVFLAPWILQYPGQGSSPQKQGSSPQKQAPSPQKKEQAKRPLSLLHKEFGRGVCWVGPENEKEIKRLVKLGVTWISITPFGYGQRVPGEVPKGGYRHSRYRGESIETMRKVTRLAKRYGVKVILKPHLWFTRGGKWRGDICFTTDEAWQAFDRAYWAFLKPYLELAQVEKIDAFCLGTELSGTTTNKKLWLGIIERSRKIYGGSLTYAAHWWKEWETAGFWHKLDWIGVQAYFPLVDFEDRNPTHKELLAGWKPWLAQLEKLSKKTGKPVLFTELGYKPRLGTTHKPWEWRSRTAPDEGAQAEAYRGFFEAVRGRKAFIGVHIWKWFTYAKRRHQDFSPQGLEGEEMLRRYFR